MTKSDKYFANSVGIILIVATVTICVCITGCKKEPQPTLTKTTTPKTNSCSIDINKFQDVLWIANDTSFADLKFYSNGNEYQKGMADGTWFVSNGCDSVKVSRVASSYYYKINSVTNDTLKLTNPFFNEVIYHK